MQPQLGIWKRFIRSLSGARRAAETAEEKERRLKQRRERDRLERMRVARQERLPVEQTWAYHSWWSGATPQWNGPGPATPGGLAPHPCNNFLSVCISTFQSILHLFNSFCTQLLMNVSNQHLNLSMNTKHHAHVQQREQMGRYSR